MMNKVDVNIKPPSKRRLKGGLIILGISGAVIGGLYAVATPFVLPAFRKIPLPYVPATARQVDNVFKMLHSAGKTSGTLVDLGSGDGRIVIEAAKYGFQATGYELNPWLVWYSRLTARLQGLQYRAEFYRRDLWKVDLSRYDSTVVFGVPSMMPKLQDKLSEELPENGVVVACRFPFPDWTPVESIDEGVDTVWCYHKNQLGHLVSAGQSVGGCEEGES
ncbi:ATP synthase subunit C lysine N-methyltransferase-like [Patiria miniata]|uniref:ATP synthase c subunit lysine N-methyltransferase n=1 Tax=Patiria miniata TaxID=46514 RepID=A0A914A021_PATMI|nr:ATP synthase subunit C lysine N-methyltransferase-like [Patiria miniata]